MMASTYTEAAAENTTQSVFLVSHDHNYFYRWEPQCVRYRFTRRMVKGSWTVFKDGRYENIVRPFLNKKVLGASKIVITDSCFDPYVLPILTKACGAENVFLYYINLIDDKNAWFMDEFPGRTYSFDRLEAQHYGIGYRHLPYSVKVPPLERCEPQYDSIFVGTEKHRIEEIEEVDRMYQQYGLDPKIMVLGCQNQTYRIDHYIRYPHYLQYIAASKSILEINQEGQSSCTLRFLEALFLKQKLVTSNRFITEDPYYDPRNVFVIGLDDPAGLRDFINSPYCETQQDLSAITFENWIRQW